MYGCCERTSPLLVAERQILAPVGFTGFTFDLCKKKWRIKKKNTGYEYMNCSNEEKIKSLLFTS